ncbi:hypothetical protein P7K49_012094 [Saguinus oedipus]|uniref:Uncharacterized protein n=1 Tax=Saguinus oedipus TaxID=9490 RepID=A0ABQ9VSS9_SAGOE|nr:hypothetical protein P7K49_012094 [Saguinus oedipus]
MHPSPGGTELLALSAKGRLLTCTLDLESEMPGSARMTAESAGRKIKELLSGIGNVSERHCLTLLDRLPGCLPLEDEPGLPPSTPHFIPSGAQETSPAESSLFLFSAQDQRAFPPTVPALGYSERTRSVQCPCTPHMTTGGTRARACHSRPPPPPAPAPAPSSVPFPPVAQEERIGVGGTRKARLLGRGHSGAAPPPLHSVLTGPEMWYPALVSFLKKAVDQRNKALTSLNEAMNVSCALLSSGAGPRPISCTTSTTWSRLQTQDVLMATCVLENRSDFSLDQGWTLCIQVLTSSRALDLDSACSAITYTIPVDRLGPGTQREVTLPLGPGEDGGLDLPVTVSCTLFYSLREVVGGALAPSDSEDPFLDECPSDVLPEQEGVCLPLSRYTVDMLQCLRFPGLAPPHTRAPSPLGPPSDPVATFLEACLEPGGQPAGPTSLRAEYLPPSVASIKVSAELLRAALEDGHSGVPLCCATLQWLLAENAAVDVVRARALSSVQGVAPDGADVHLIVREASRGSGKRALASAVLRVGPLAGGPLPLGGGPAAFPSPPEGSDGPLSPAHTEVIAESTVLLGDTCTPGAATTNPPLTPCTARGLGTHCTLAAYYTALSALRLGLVVALGVGADSPVEKPQRTVSFVAPRPLASHFMCCVAMTDICPAGPIQAVEIQVESSSLADMCRAHHAVIGRMQPVDQMVDPSEHTSSRSTRNRRSRLVQGPCSLHCDTAMTLTGMSRSTVTPVISRHHNGLPGLQGLILSAGRLEEGGALSEEALSTGPSGPQEHPVPC